MIEFLHIYNNIDKNAEKILKFAGYRSENNFVGILKIMSNTAKNCDILADLSVLHNYSDSPTKLLF